MSATTGELELERWRKQLGDFHRPWPEWDQLIAVVNDATFTLESDPDVPFPTQFLVGPSDQRGCRIIHNVLTPRQEEQFHNLAGGNSVLPRYLVPLLDIKYSDCLMMAGGIGGCLCPWSTEVDFNLPTRLSPKICENEPVVIYNRDPSKVLWPENPTFPFQTNSSGAYFFADQNGDVKSFSLKEMAFVPIGSMTNLIRYSLASVLAGKDWYTSYSKCLNLADYKLTFFLDAGID